MKTNTAKPDRFANRKRLYLLAALLCALPAFAAHAFDRIVVFGTSLSDPGNYFALHPNNAVPPYTNTVDEFLVPAYAYAIGGHHLSNGPTWIEQFALGMGLGASVQPALSVAGASNYAVDGARARNDGINFNLQDQVMRFQEDFPTAPPDALYVMEMGSNDVRDALGMYLNGQPTSGQSILGQALFSISTELQTLYAMGARHFLLWNVPDLWYTPSARKYDEVYGTGTAVRDLARTLTVGFNAQLNSIVSALQSLPGIDIKVLDAYDDLDQIVNNPGAYGLSDVQDACITPGVAPFTCQKPSGYLFWDGIHPTKAGHGIIERFAASLLGP